MKIVQTKIGSPQTHTLLKLNSLNVGDYLVFDIFIKKEHDYVIIIEKGTLLTEELLSKLQKQSSLYITKEDSNKKELNCISLKNYIYYNKKNMQKSLEYLYTINGKVFEKYLNSQDNKIDLKCVEEIIKTIIFLNNDNKKFLQEIMQYFVNEHELPTHSLHVTIYSLSLGKFLKLNTNELLQLGTASLLHDIGMKKISSQIINQNKKLTLAELESVQQHSIYSTQIIKHNHILDPYIIDAVTHHHENYDGTGYPDALMGSDISIFASIISIADVFDALTNARPNREALNSFSALKVMMKDDTMANKFNYTYLQGFLKLL